MTETDYCLFEAEPGEEWLGQQNGIFKSNSNIVSVSFNGGYSSV